jgi:hypothetical protein
LANLTWTVGYITFNNSIISSRPIQGIPFCAPPTDETRRGRSAICLRRNRNRESQRQQESRTKQSRGTAHAAGARRKCFLPAVGGTNYWTGFHPQPPTLLLSYFGDDSAPDLIRQTKKPRQILLPPGQK